MKRLLLNLFLWSVACMQAMPEDTLYHVRFISAADSSPLSFAILRARGSGLIIASWETDAGGYIRITKNQINSKPPVVISLHHPGFARRTFKADTLLVNDTILMAVEPQPAMLDHIRIIAYKVPLIEKETKAYSRRRKQPEEAPEVFPVYSSESCLAYEALQKGLYLNKDSAGRRRILAWDTANTSYKDKGSGLSQMFQRYLMHNINYPQQARDFLMEETLYICFEFGEKGEVSYLQIMKGKHVDLVLEVANALARMPRINLRDLVPDYGESYPPKRFKPVRMLLPVQFTLQ